MSERRPLRVCYFGTYRAEYSRNQIMIEGLRRNGVEVVECHQQLWRGIEDRVQAASGGWRHPSFFLRLVSTYLRLLKQYTRTGRYDLLVVGYPGVFDVFLARLLSWLKRKPLVWDVFMSIYLIALERGLDRRSRLTIAALRFLEGRALRLPDRLIQDTSEYAGWLSEQYGIRQDRFRLVPTGADDRIFKPVEDGAGENNAVCRVVYYGTFIPNHGVSQMIEAARCLADHADIRFELIGDGPERVHAEDLARQFNLMHVHFYGWLAPEELARQAASADIILGAFGNTPQSLMTVQNKIYEGLAMGRAVITGDSPAVRQVLQDGADLLLCERGNPQSLSEAILRLSQDAELRRRLGRTGLATFRAHYDLEHIGQRFASHLDELCRLAG